MRKNEVPKVFPGRGVDVRERALEMYRLRKSVKPRIGTTMVEAFRSLVR